MRRRTFITLLGGAAAWLLAARSQQGERMRRIGVLIPGARDDRIFQARLAAFLRQLQELGWADGRNIRIDTPWGACSRRPSRLRRLRRRALLTSRASSIRLSLPKEGGHAIGEYHHHNHKHAPDDHKRKIHLAMISTMGPIRLGRQNSNRGTTRPRRRTHSRLQARPRRGSAAPSIPIS